MSHDGIPATAQSEINVLPLPTPGTAAYPCPAVPILIGRSGPQSCGEHRSSTIRSGGLRNITPSGNTRGASFPVFGVRSTVPTGAERPTWGKAMRLGVPARLGVVASILLLPASVLLDLPSMGASVSASAAETHIDCLQRAIRSGRDGSGGAMFPEHQPCDGVEDAARESAVRSAMVASAGRAIARILAMWLIGFLALRLWRWIMAGRDAATAE